MAVPVQNLRKIAQAPVAAAAEAVYRIGSVSRLAGVPVTTLRVWERRYAAFAPAKSGGQHRLYTEGDVIKARLLRQLTSGGHSIGAIAHLDAHALQRLLVRERGSGAAPPQETPRVSVAVVGDALAARLHSPLWKATYLAQGLDLQQVFEDLDALEATPVRASRGTGTRDPQLLLVRLNTVHAEVGEQLARAIAQVGARQAIVLYVYGAQPTVEALRAAGMIVRREPVSDADLAELIRSQVVVDAAASIASAQAGALIPRRRFSDAVLARIAGRPSHLLCECPRHIAELLTQLGSFEEYSRECLNRSSEDAQVHAYLRSVAGSARALFERALEMVALHDGLELQREEAGDATRSAEARPQPAQSRRRKAPGGGQRKVR